MGCQASSSAAMTTAPQSAAPATSNVAATPAANSGNHPKGSGTATPNRNVSPQMNKSGRHAGISNSPDPKTSKQGTGHSTPSLSKITESKKAEPIKKTVPESKDQKAQNDKKPSLSPSKVSLNVAESSKTTTSVVHLAPNNPETVRQTIDEEDPTKEPVDEKRRKSIKKKGSVDPKLNELVKIYGFN